MTRLLKQARQGINPALVGEAFQVALGLLGNFKRRPEDHDRVGIEIAEQVRRAAGLGKLALEIHNADGWKRISRAELVEIELFDRFDLVIEEIDANGQADLIR